METHRAGTVGDGEDALAIEGFRTSEIGPPRAGVEPGRAA
jgi:hypothetical protein